MADLSPRAGWALVLVATATMAVSYVDRQAVAALAPTITTDLGISDSAFGWLGSAFSIAYLLFAPLAGRLIDGVGARRGLVGAVLAWSVVAAAHALVPGFVSLFALRILLGCAEAPSFPGAAQTVARALPPARRSTGFGVLFTGSSLGAALSAVLAPTLEARYGWRIALLGTAVVGLAWVPLWLWVSGGAAARAALDRPAEHPAAGPGASRWAELLRDPAVLRAIAAVVASAPVVGMVLQFSAKLLVASHGLTQTAVRDYLWLPPLAFDAGAVTFGLLASARARRDVAGAAAAPHRGLFATAALLCLAIAGVAFAHTPWETTGAEALALAGAGGVYALATADMLARVAPGRVAAAGGLTAAAQSLALIVAFPLIGSAVDHTHSYTGVALALAAWLVPGAAVWLWIDPRRVVGTLPRTGTGTVP
jgi:ACS family hexuronate transporter-like MFS transporter